MPINSSLLTKISADLLLSSDSLDRIIKSAPHRYKVYPIAKKSGGTRIIAQPAVEVKRIQYWVINNIYPSFQIHESATAYFSGRNILSNCRAHAANPYLLKLDFRDFFPSILSSDFEIYASNIIEFADDDLGRLTRILFWCPKGQKQLRLSIGAPSSPHLSNAIMYEFDSLLSAFCSKEQIAYTRYADDLTFSMKERSLRRVVLEKVRCILGDLRYPKLTLNESKTMHCSKANRRIVTGLVISNDGQVSLGHANKRLIRTKYHRYITGGMTGDEAKSMGGLLSFAQSIEPEFVMRLRKRYEGRIFS